MNKAEFVNEGEFVDEVDVVDVVDEVRVSTRLGSSTRSTSSTSSTNSTKSKSRSRSPLPRYRIRALSRPATGFTGDFFFSTEVDDALWFAVGDFAGHGLHSTIFMAMVQEMIETAIHDCASASPAEVIAIVDRDLREELPYNRFATLVIGRAMPDGRLQLVNAGHCRPVIVRRDARVESIGSHGPVVGIAPGAAWREEIVELHRGDRLFIYTDGLSEAENDLGEEFGAGRLIGLIETTSVAQPLETIVDAVDRFARRRVDDQTLFVLEAR